MVDSTRKDIQMNNLKYFSMKNWLMSWLCSYLLALIPIRMLWLLYFINSNKIPKNCKNYTRNWKELTWQHWITTHLENSLTWITVIMKLWECMAPPIWVFKDNRMHLKSMAKLCWKEDQFYLAPSVFTTIKSIILILIPSNLIDGMKKTVEKNHSLMSHSVGEPEIVLGNILPKIKLKSFWLGCWLNLTTKVQRNSEWSSHST